MSHVSRQTTSSGERSAFMSGPASVQFKVQVTVDKEVFLVGVADPHLTVAWMANHVAERYRRETGTRVVLRIRDSNGAKLAPEDLLGIVLANGDKLTTEVTEVPEDEGKCCIIM